MRLGIGIARHRDLGDPGHPTLDGVRDVGDDLDSLAQVVSSPLLVDDMLIDLASRDVVVTMECDIEKAMEKRKSDFKN